MPLYYPKPITSPTLLIPKNREWSTLILLLFVFIGNTPAFFVAEDTNTTFILMTLSVYMSILLGTIISLIMVWRSIMQVILWHPIIRKIIQDHDEFLRFVTAYGWMLNVTEKYRFRHDLLQDYFANLTDEESEAIINK